MAEIMLECQGLPCPQPVLRCKRCIEESAPDELVVIVDNDPARENVSRFLASKGYAITSVEPENGSFRITAAKGPDTQDACRVCAPMDAEEMHGLAGSGKTLVFIPSSTMGSGNDELGSRLMHNLLATLPEMGPELWRIVLVNSGVELAVAGSPALESLEKLDRAGVSILVCGTCLEFFGLTKNKAVGQTTNMLDIVTSCQLADKVIRI